jgi:Skp family chaperone for outer membrane proteins
MRYMIPVLALFIASCAMGCAPTEGQAAEKPIQGETQAMQMDKVKKETKEAVQAMQDYNFARKAEFVAKTQKELDALQVEMDRLAAQVDRSKAEAKADAKVRLDAVRENWAKTKENLEQAENATEEAWNDVKLGFEKSRNDLKESIDNTRQWLSDKIEP